MNDDDPEDLDFEEEEETNESLPTPDGFTERQQALWAALHEGGPTANGIAATLVNEALSPLKAALDSDSETYQFNAVSSTAHLPEPIRSNALIDLLAHVNYDVRSEAMLALEQSFVPAGRDSLLKFLSEGDDGQLRARVAVLLARDKDTKLIEIIQLARKGEINAEALHDYDLALARLRDVEARKRVALRLNDLVPRRRLEVIRDYIYIDDVTSLEDLRPLLNVTDPLINTRPAHSNFEVILRVCDAAAEVMVKVARLQVGVDEVILGRAPLTDTQLAAVRAALGQVGH
jgi:hypothetical protein